MRRPLLGLVTSMLCLTTAGGAAGGMPDLAVTAASVTRRGETVRVTDTITNRGAVVAARSTAAYYLGSRRIGTRTVRQLEPGAASRGSKALAIPSTMNVGTYLVRVCADGGKRIREARETNNCRTAGRVRVRDRIPPVFAGITQATFCSPGPIGPDRPSRYFVKWEPARDTVTRADRIVYDIYEAPSSGAERFTTPTWTTRGATTFTTPPLPTASAHYFVVRARDVAGNRDRNTVERQAVSICV